MSSKLVTESLLEIRRGAEEILVEAELIEHEIKRHLGESDNSVDLPDDKRDPVVAELLKVFNNDDAFKKMDDGRYSVDLDGESVREAARKLLMK